MPGRRRNRCGSLPFIYLFVCSPGNRALARGGQANRHETTSVNACEDCSAVMVGYGYRRPLQWGTAAHVFSVDSGQEKTQDQGLGHCDRGLHGAAVPEPD